MSFLVIPASCLRFTERAAAPTVKSSIDWRILFHCSSSDDENESLCSLSKLCTVTSAHSGSLDADQISKDG